MWKLQSRYSSQVWRLVFIHYTRQVSRFLYSHYAKEVWRLLFRQYTCQLWRLLYSHYVSQVKGLPNCHYTISYGGSFFAIYTHIWRLLKAIISVRYRGSNFVTFQSVTGSTCIATISVRFGGFIAIIVVRHRVSCKAVIPVRY